jgi:hypothetical protein
VFAFRDLVTEFCSSEAHDRMEIDMSSLMSNLDKLEAACPALAEATQAGIGPARSCMERRREQRPNG